MAGCDWGVSLLAFAVMLRLRRVCPDSLGGILSNEQRESVTRVMTLNFIQHTTLPIIDRVFFAHPRSDEVHAWPRRSMYTTSNPPRLTARLEERQGGERRLCADQRRSDRGQWRARGRSGAGQQRARGCGLVLQVDHRRPVRAGRPDGCRRLQELLRRSLSVTPAKAGVAFRERAPSEPSDPSLRWDDDHGRGP